MSKPNVKPPATFDLDDRIIFGMGLRAGLREGSRLERESKKLKAVIFAGDLLSNVAFNLKQNAEVKKEWRTSMEECQKAWDAALSAWSLKSRAKRKKQATP